MRIGTESDLQALKEYWLPSRRFGGRNRGRPSTLERGYGNREAEIIWLASPRFGERGRGWSGARGKLSMNWVAFGCRRAINTQAPITTGFAGEKGWG